MSADREVEWQLDAVDLRPVRRWITASEPDQITLEPLGAGLHLDRYLDTDDWRLHRAGLSLRVRTQGRQSEATAKSLEAPLDGLRNRRELTEQLGSADLRQAPGEVGRLVRSLIGRHPLRPLFSVRTRRERFALRVGGEAAGELSLDDTTIPIEGGAPARLQRVEVEVDPDRVKDVAPMIEELAAACGLHAAVASKFETGLLATGLTPPGPVDLGPTELSDAVTVGELAFAVLRTQFAEMLEHEPGARVGDDPEEVHDMRVAIRRMRAATSTFREALPVRAHRLREELKWVAAALGEVRDLDVQLNQFREWERDMPAGGVRGGSPAGTSGGAHVGTAGGPPDEDDRDALAPLLARLEERHRAAREHLVQQLDSRRYDRLVASMTDFLRRGPLRRSPASRTPAVVAAPDLVRRRYRPVRKRGKFIGRDSAPEDLHALRIRCKRLRYTLEFLSPLAPKPTQRLVRRLVAVQDVLGEHQDAQVAMAHVDELAGEDLPARAVFLLGRIAERYARRAEELRGELPAVFSKLRGRRWRRLRSALEARRDEALAAMPRPRVPSLRTAPPPGKGEPDPASGPGAPSPLTIVRS